MNDPRTDKVIRISKDEALSGHVEDMLKRQMSMRGDPGVARGRRNWFYQNWFIFGLVGTIGALLAWALIEPSFRDLLYIQGPVTSTFQMETNSADDDPSENQSSSVHRLGAVTLNDEKIIVTSATREIKPNGAYVRLKALQEGEPIGVYVERERASARNEDSPVVNVARFIVRSPRPQPPDKVGVSLNHLASRQAAVGMLVFPLVAGFIGLFIGAADGIVCRLPRRALFCGAVGLVAGFVGGFVSSIIANIVYAPLTQLAMHQSEGSAGLSSIGFGIQLIGRSLAWALAGIAMGLGQGIALRSKRLLIYGLLGGGVGGLFGGVLFDPIDLLLLGPDKPSAALSRLIGFGVIGLCVGIMIGLVELLARDAWLRMTQGPLTGKEFLIFKDVMNVGSSPRSDIYLFNDPLVAEQHAIIRGLGDECEIEARQTTSPVMLNNRSVTRARLRHGDNVTIGRTSFVFQQRKN